MTARDERLTSERNIWLATTREDGRPHLIPIWFVWIDEAAYIVTGSDSVKVRNLLHDPRASFALKDGDQPVIAECDAILYEQSAMPDAVQAAFVAKYDWDISSDEGNLLIALRPYKWLKF